MYICALISWLRVSCFDVPHAKHENYHLVTQQKNSIRLQPVPKFNTSSRERMPPRRKMPHIKRSLPSKSHNWNINSHTTNFKERYRNHTSSFRHQNKRHETELSKHIFTLKDNNRPFNLKWKTIKQCKPCNKISKNTAIDCH